MSVELVSGLGTMDHVLPFHWLINVWLTPMSEVEYDPTEMQNVVDGRDGVERVGLRQAGVRAGHDGPRAPVPLLDEGLWR